MKKCKPSRYAVIAADRVTITYGFRCAFHRIHSRRYSTSELREERMGEHIKLAKKKQK